MLPNMSDVLNGFTQPLTLIEVVQDVVDYNPVNVETSIEIQAVVQVADPERIMSGKVDFSKRYLQIHTTQALKNIFMCVYKEIRYRAFLTNDYSDYGYFESYFEEMKGA